MNPIEFKNAKLAKMSPARKRVAVAVDVIQQIRANRYVAAVGNYISPLAGGELHGIDAVEFARKPDMRCEVCARGGMFLSMLNLFNNFDDLLRPRLVLDKETEFFPIEQVYLIECAFEGWDRKRAGDQYYMGSRDRIEFIEVGYNAYPKFYTEDLEPVVLRYIEDYPNPEERLIVIMKNVIKNKGTFIP